MEAWKSNGGHAENIAIAGAGTMGRLMVEKILEKGYPVWVADPSPAAAQLARDLGARIADKPEELAANCQVIILSLPGPAQVEQVLFGEGGLHGALRPGQVIVDTSTVDPNTTKRMAERVSPLGVAYLDCPILGRPSAVGRWFMPVGGNPDALHYVEEVLSAVAAGLVSVGDSGAGNAVKLLNQMMFTAINAVSAEVMAIADKVGVKKEVFYNMVAQSPAATVSGLFKEVGGNIVKDDYTHPAFTVDLLIKDTGLALQMAREAKAPSVIAGTVQMYNELASANGLGSQDTSALYKIFSGHYKEE